MSPANSWRRSVPGAIFLLIAAYGLGMSTLLLIRLTPLAQSPWIEFFSNLLPLPLLPAVPFALLSLIGRRPFKALAQLIPVAFLLVSYGPFYAPRTTAAASTADSLVVVTHNLYARQSGFETVVAMLRATDADVITLQELSLEAAAALEAELGERYPHRALHPQSSSPIHGQGILSKFPIVDDEFWRIGLGQQRAVLEIHGRQVTVYNPHPNMPFEFKRLPPFDAMKRDAVMDDMLQRLARESGPVIVAGDFNFNDQSYQYERLAAVLTDSWREAGFGMGNTWPAVHDADYEVTEWPQAAIPAPIMRIDFVFHSAHFATQDVQVWPTSVGSDHRPVRATLVLR